MSNNIINFNTARNQRILDNLKKEEIGNINITVYLEEKTKYTFYYILPNKKELIPIVNLLDDTLKNNCFKLSNEISIQKI